MQLGRWRKNKFGSVKTEVDGITFHSKKEARRYKELKLLEAAGQIANLRLQVSHDLIVNGIQVCRYRADFVYTDKRNGREITEDSKGYQTPEYVIKRNLMKACLGVEILET